ncbi:ABC transporter permease [Flavilitoribacter nigricans]|uniref:Antibiotic ABC transporter permease n=1 Tax=Flavilitoribacter nigricans (strain ATCC 23147 / DSM 23189 / NBRC 102662 / NCIMB 1420 / SS-2) TaxID=1122177 RepID=A0A2D0NAR4_FLAN2|nr:ABC transporter permease [Flavilitoribacter nigricans]PHN05259.1 antibiotic ABC transporter permease [Flavilitoribacter nigricans DSM 23189 = NBRC 102662]
MFTNYLKTALRHLAHHKLNTFINISGLAMGVACLLLAVTYWLDERSFDNFHENTDQLYRITTKLVDREGSDPKMTGGSGQVQGPAFREAVPEVQDYVRVLGGDIYGDVRHEREVLNLQMLFVDDNFLEMFTFPALQGNPATALDELNSIVLSESTAMRFFNTTDAVGKLLHLDADPSARRLGHKPMLVTAVVDDPPANSSIQFDVLLPFRFLQLSFDDKNWLNAYLGTFLLLDERADRAATVEKFNRIYAQQAAGQLEEASFDPDISYGLQPITDMHLNMLLGGSGWHEGGTVGESRPVYSNLFLGIAFFIFLLAGINFVNINIAGSLRRAREVSIRKITGSSRRGLVIQFLGEAALLCGISLILALILAIIALPAFNTLADKQVALADLINWKFGLGLALIFLTATLLSGLYPAIVLSGFQPGDVLYNRSVSPGRSRLGRALVVLQFSLAFILAVGTLVFRGQMEFIHQKDLGYEPAYVIRTHIGGNREYAPIQQLLQNEVARNDNFEAISFGGDFGYESAETTVGDQKVRAVHKSADRHFLPVMGIDLRLGQNFTAENQREVIVNEAFVRAAGLEEPIGASVRLHPDFTDWEEPMQIVGVVADYHYESLHKPVQPLAIYQLPRNRGGIWLKIKKENTQAALQDFEALYQKVIPDASYEYQFLTDLNAREYDREQRWQRIISIAAVLALLICCLGLFGISHLHTVRRTREIGIRKVLGATTAGLVRLLSRDFLVLVVIALVLASPVAYYLVRNWLQEYAYRIDIRWWIFVLAGLASIAVAFLTVSIHCLRAARANPVESLSND